MRKPVSVLFVLGAATPAIAQPAAEISTGVEYQEGDYGTGESVETLSVQNQLRVRTGRANITASHPCNRIYAQ